MPRIVTPLCDMAASSRRLSALEAAVSKAYRDVLDAMLLRTPVVGIPPRNLERS